IENKGNISSKKRKYNQEKGRLLYTSSTLWERRIQEAREKFKHKDEETKREGVRDIKELIESHSARIDEILPQLLHRQENSQLTLSSDKFFSDDPYIKSALLMARDDKNIPLATRLRIATAYSSYDPRGFDHFAALLSEIGEDAHIRQEAIALFKKLKIGGSSDEIIFKEVCEECLGLLSDETN
ncbi:MAG: hypothetical protein HYX35_06015, partial [Proteobacteria bacterium]|nr:hypothetical protein [Pseudomonadota bacterium]